MYGHVIWRAALPTSGPSGENPSDLARFGNGPANFGRPGDLPQRERRTLSTSPSSPTPGQSSPPKPPSIAEGSVDRRW